ncbi:unnamed protein product [Meganyctiphanes norvegica]|uniref:Major facilitator superfamily (MFS) profile domain-containing protein n=1 Tax=Meganyctiphanes norvegica TaxID=48144 RepID=A0AAV2SJA1_MEGNR
MDKGEGSSLKLSSGNQNSTLVQSSSPPVNSFQRRKPPATSPRKRKLLRSEQLKKETLRRCSTLSIASTVTPDENIDDILTTIGIGRWQILFIISTCLTKASFPPLFLGSVFTNMPMNFKCSNSMSNDSYQNKFNNLCTTNNRSLVNHSNFSCDYPEFDTSVFSSTFNSEFRLVCEHYWLSSWFQYSFTIGLCIGSTLIGLSDKNGRMVMVRLGAVGCLTGSLLVGLAPNIGLVLVGRFIQGVFIPITNVSGYALALETTPPRHRTKIGYLIWVPCSLSLILLGTTGYFIRNWRQLQLITYTPIYLNAIIVFFLDKSPRWLVQQGQINMAVSILERAGKLNGVDIPQTILVPLLNDAFQNVMNQWEIKGRDGLLISAIKSAKFSAMQVIWIVPPLICFFDAIIYFGVPLNANNFTENPFLYMIMTGAAAIPPTVLSDFFIRKIGIIYTLVITFATTGVCMVSSLGVPSELWWLKWVLVGASMMSICMANNTCDYMIFALFPTVFRSLGFSIMFLLFYIGSQFAYFLIGPVQSSKWWSFNVICGLCCFVCICLALILPEVQFEPLCETVEEVKQREIRIKEKISQVSKCCNCKSIILKGDSKGKTINQCSKYPKCYVNRGFDQ